MTETFRSNGTALKAGALVPLLAALFMGAVLGSTSDALMALAMLPGLLAALAMLVQPLFGLMALAFVIPFENITVELTAGAGTVTRFLGIFVAGTWLAQKLARRESWDSIIRSAPMVALALFVVFALASNLWTQIPFSVPGQAVRLVMFVSLAVLTVDLVRDWKDARRLIAALLAGGLVASVLVVDQYLTHGGRAGDNIGGGINSTGMVLVILVPLAFCLVRTSVGGWRLLGIAYLTLGLPAVLLTFSRAALLVLILLMSVELAYSLWTGRGRGALLVGGAAVALLAFHLVPYDEVADRAETIGPTIEQTLQGGTGDVPTTSARGYHIQIGLAIFRDHPVVGAGWGSYRRLFVEDYQFRVPGSRNIYGTPRSPHGTFWGVLADLGLIGLFLWLLALGLAAWALRRAWRAAVGAGQMMQRARFSVQATALSLFSLFLYMGFQNVETRKVFWIVFGLAVVLHRLVGSDRGPSAPWHDSSPTLASEPLTYSPPETATVPVDKS